jgi:hypothetical protein
MCIFCGGQCGGFGEFLISLGLPFLGLYFYRIRNFLAKIINKIFRRSSGVGEIPNKAMEIGTCGELLQDFRVISPQSIDPKNLTLIDIKPKHDRPEERLPGITKLSEPSIPKKKRELKGVRGWLLLLCLNLTFLIPASSLYGVISILYFINSPLNQIALIVSKNLLLYHMILLAIMAGLATLSFYAGLQLWDVKPGAVKLTKIFLIIQLFLSVIIAVIRPLMTFPFGSGGNNFIIIIQTLIPSLIYFSLWYLYLNNSIRVYNTFGETEPKRVIIGAVHAK